MMNNSYMRLVSSMNGGLIIPIFTNTKSILFDGVDEYVDLNEVSILDNVANYTISMWIKSTSLASTAVTIGRKTNNSDTNFSVYIATDGSLHNAIGASAGNTAASVITASTWYHIVATYNGGAAAANRIQLYVDGVSSLDSVTGTIPTTTNNDAFKHYLGGRSNSNTMDLPFTGNIDEVGLFDYTLTSGEVTALYNSGCPNDLMTLAAAKRPEHYYRMGDGDTYPTLLDSGETGGNDGTMTNMESTDIVTNTPCGFNNFSTLFGGTDESVQLNNVPEVDGVTNFSISYWFKKATTATNWFYHTGTYTSGSDGVIVRQVVTSKYMEFWVDGGRVRSTTTIEIDVWHLITVVYDGSLTGNTNRAKVYIDGVNETVNTSGTIPATRASGGADFEIGKAGGLAASWTEGNIDEHRIYDYSLSASDVTDIYNSGVPKADDLSVKAVHKYRMGDGDTFPTLLDSGTGTTLNGTMTNMEAGDINGDVPI